MSKIAIFDSGLGGITVLEELYRLLPNESYIYFGDSKHAPYGDKSNDQIREYTENIINFFLKNDVKMLVIACNTVTSFLYNELVNTLDIPVIGVIFPTVNYVNDLRIRKVGVIATYRTIENKTYQRLINKQVYALATPQLVPMVEDGSYKERDEDIKQALAPILNQNIHALVLGCTHYPFLKQQIEQVYSGIIVDSGLVTAIEVKEYLEHNFMLEDNPQIDIYVSGDVASFNKIIKNYVSFNYTIHHLEV